MSITPVVISSLSGNDYDGAYGVKIFTSQYQGDYALITNYEADSVVKVYVDDVINGKYNPFKVEQIIGADNYLEGASRIAVGTGDNHGLIYVTGNVSDSLVIIRCLTYGIYKTGEILGSENYLDGAFGVAIQGDYVFVASQESNAFVIINVSSSSNPYKVSQLIGYDDHMQDISDVAVDGNYAYVVGTGGYDYVAELVIIDISDKENPSVIGFVGEEDYIMLSPVRVKIYDNYAYVTSLFGLTIIDISDKSSPSIKSQLEIEDLYADGIAIAGRYAYVGTYTHLRIVDILYKLNPSLVASLEGFSNISDITIKDGYLYVTEWNGDTFSIINPQIYSAPIASITTTGISIIIEWEYPSETASFTADIYYIRGYDIDADTIKSDGEKISVGAVSRYVFTSLVLGLKHWYSFIVVVKDSDLFESAKSNVVTDFIDGEYEESYNPGGKTMLDLHSNIIYRLNIASDIHARTEQVRFWSDDEILTAINEGYLDFVRRTMCLQKFGIIPLEEDEDEYDLPTDCIKLLWVGDGTRNLVGQSLDYMDQLDEKWLEQTGTPSYYVQELGGIKKIFLYEAPETAGGASFTADSNHSEADVDHGLLVGATDDGTALTFTADSNHTEADADHGIILAITGESGLLKNEKTTGIIVEIDQQTDNLMILYAYEPQVFDNLQEAKTPEFLAAYHPAIVNFALSELYLKEGDTQNMPLADFYRMLYEDAVQSKLEIRHVSNLPMVHAQESRRDKTPSGPHLPYDQYPAYRR